MLIDMPTMVAVADLTGQPGSGPKLLSAVSVDTDIKVGILDAP